MFELLLIEVQRANSPFVLTHLARTHTHTHTHESHARSNENHSEIGENKVPMRTVIVKLGSNRISRRKCFHQNGMEWKPRA